ncbi:TlpA family protein disulfide reductase [Parasalinivibrio latis]|uniref:peroxiredoxin family protein n=1 Tax=Parasalinivibrio latis TaxID=2952610 RepID=UPI0030DF3C20
MNYPRYGLAPELTASEWFNVEQPLSLADLRGKVVVLYVFQMLCPACVSHGVPQMRKLQQHFGSAEIQVLGLHSVFEHYEAMGPVSLDAFLHEYRINFPVAVDEPGGIDPVPKTMQEFRLQGTPTVVVIDRDGYIRFHALGPLDDMVLGHVIGTLMSEDETDHLNIAEDGSEGWPE